MSERPFTGLRPFEYADREYFFGRQSQIYALYRLLDRSRFVAVIGSSGSGKSSLVRAGLLPLLDAAWETVTFRPGGSPLSALADALDDLASRKETAETEADPEIRRELIDFAVQRSSFGLSKALSHVPNVKNKKLLIVVDQFEELFRFATPDSRNDAAQLVQILLEASRAQTNDVRVLITMRSDFIGDCAQFQNLPEAVSASQFLVPSLTRDQREEVIRKPIEKAGGTIEPDLVERLLNDVGGEMDQLPVLQHCLMRLWDCAGPSHHMSEDLYRSPEIGSIANALSRHADLVMASMPGSEKTVEQIFRALSEIDSEGRAMRRAIPLWQLVAESGLGEDDLRTVLDRLRENDCSFIAPPRSTLRTLRSDTLIDVGHEALLRRWTRISADPEQSVTGEAQKGWLYIEKDDGDFYRACLSLLKGKSKSDIVTLPLSEVEKRWEWWSNPPRTPAWCKRYGGNSDRIDQLFTDSLRSLKDDSAKRRRLTFVTRALTAGAFFAALVVATLGVVSIRERQEADAQRNNALAERQNAITAKATAQTEAAVAEVAKATAEARRHDAVRAEATALARGRDAIKAATLAQRAEASAVRNENALKRETVQLNEQQTALLIPQSELLARDARSRIEGGDAVTGMLLALEALPRQIAHPDRPFLFDAHAALESGVARRRELHDLIGHTGLLSVAVFSPDGTRVATASADGTARLWDVKSGALTSVLKHDGAVRSVAFSPDGKRVATASLDKTARLWDTQTGAQIAVLPHANTVNTVAFSSDGTRIVTASNDKTARLWDAKTGVLVLTLHHDGQVNSAAFSPDGSLVVTASSDKAARVWRTTTGEPLFRLPLDNAVYSASFSPDGKRIITLSADWKDRIWNLDASPERPYFVLPENGYPYSAGFSPDGMRLVTSGSHGARVWGLSTTLGNSNLADNSYSPNLIGTLYPAGAIFTAAFSPDGTRIVSAATDGQARIFDANGALISILGGHTGWVRSAAFSPDGKLVVTASNDATARIWDGGPGQQPYATLLGHEGGVNFGTFSPDGARVITISDDKTARLWDGKTGNLIAALQQSGAIKVAAFSPDSRLVVTGSSDGSVREWDARTGAPTQIVFRHKNAVRTIEFSPDGSLIATASSDRNAGIWSARTGAQIALLQHGGVVNSAKFSPDGKHIVTASDDKITRVFDVKTLRQIDKYDDPALPVDYAVYSPDGTRIATALSDWTVRLWDLNTHKQIAVLRNHNSLVHYVAFSPNGERIVTASNDNTARLWDGRTGAPIAALGTFTSAAFSPDGSRIVTGSFGGTAPIWDGRTGALVDALRGPPNTQVWYAAFSPDGARAVSTSSDKTARLWNVSGWMLNCQALIDHARQNLPRHLTKGQRQLEFIDPRPTEPPGMSFATGDTCK